MSTATIISMIPTYDLLTTNNCELQYFLNLFIFFLFNFLFFLFLKAFIRTFPEFLNDEENFRLLYTNQSYFLVGARYVVYFVILIP